MEQMGPFVFGIWLILALIVIPLIVPFIRALRKSVPQVHENNFLPPTLLVLCLRGPDPWLNKCLKAILSQDYPNYQVRIIVDSEQDPAWEIVQETLRTIKITIPCTVMPLKVRPDTCSLKCSAIIQALSAMDPSCEVVGFVDGDVIPHRTWLRELVAPLADPQVGATTGNRWYNPPIAQWGSLIRYVWNFVAVLFMYLFDISWGGTLALKTGVLREGKLLEKWKTALTEDTLIYSTLQNLGMRLHFAPDLMMVNREECSLRNFISFSLRQLVYTRLYHPKWRILLALGITYLTFFTVALVGTFSLIYQNDGTSLLWALGGWGLCLISYLGYIGWLEREIGVLLKRRGETLAKWFRFRLLPAITFIQVYFPLELIRANFWNTLKWRGVSYQIGGPWKIRRLDGDGVTGPLSTHKGARKVSR